MNNFIFLLIGFLSSQKISFFGEVYVGELFCLVVLLFNFKAIRYPKNSKAIFGLLLVWFISQLSADFINQTEFIKIIKGTLAPILVAMILLGLTTVFYNRYDKLPLYLFGVFTGILLNRMLGSEYYAQNPWKWGLGISVALCFFTWIDFYCKSNKVKFLLLGSAIFVVISMASSSRALAGFMVISSVITVFSGVIIKTRLYRNLCTSPYGLIQLLLGIFVVVFVLDRSMVALFSYEPFLDFLPSADAMKYSIQAESKWGVILGGRTELLISLEAFFDAPFFGHGSWAENSYYTYAHLDMVDASGGMLIELSVAEDNINSFLIPTHSYLMGAMVWGGFFAGLFWVKVLGLSLAGLLNEKVISSPLLLFIVITLVWNILFSPFGADARWLSTVLLWVYISMCNNVVLHRA